MNISGSECSSGWTTYFDHYSNSEDQYNRVYGDDQRRKLEFCSEDEDLSMVSDASSGPPHFREDDDEYSYSVPEGYKGKQKRKSKELWGEKQNFYLDDTASSPSFSFPYKENTTSSENVPGVSEKHLKGKSVLGKHFGFLKSSKSGKAASLKSGGMKGRKQQ